MRVGDHFARIVARAKEPLDESVEMERFGPADFNGAIQGSARRNPRDRTRDIVRRNRLDEHRRHTNGVAVGGGVGDALQELEELRGLDDRVRDRGFLDQLLLRELRAEVAAFQQTFGSDNRQRHMMSDAGGGFSR